jgi:glycerol-3-phosphate dehydrogenase (NAD(P)+)
MSNIAIMGGGAWGTALALNLAQRGGHSITLWTHSPAVAETIRTRRENTAFLPGFKVPPSITITSKYADALSKAEILLSVMPSHHVRESYEKFIPHLRAGQSIVSATKGIEDQSGLRMSEVIAKVLAPRGLNLPIAVLSGPSFAQEVAAG